MTFDILGILNLFSPFVYDTGDEPEPTPPADASAVAVLGMDLYSISATLGTSLY